MAHNTISKVYLPHSNASTTINNTKANSQGKGMGSVLLRTGGAGNASSYQDLDDYMATTGINPYARAVGSTGTGVTGLSKKIAKQLSELHATPSGSSKRKNIVMTF